MVLCFLGGDMHSIPPANALKTTCLPSQSMSERKPALSEKHLTPLRTEFLPCPPLSLFKKCRGICSSVQSRKILRDLESVIICKTVLKLLLQLAVRYKDLNR